MGKMRSHRRGNDGRLLQEAATRRHEENSVSNNEIRMNYCAVWLVAYELLRSNIQLCSNRLKLTAKDFFSYLTLNMHAQDHQHCDVTGAKQSMLYATKWFKLITFHVFLSFQVRDLVEKCTCPSQFPMIRVSEGKYRIGDTKVLIFVRVSLIADSSFSWVRMIYDRSLALMGKSNSL